MQVELLSPSVFPHTLSHIVPYLPSDMRFAMPSSDSLNVQYLSESNKLRNWMGKIYCVAETRWNCELKGPIGHVWCLKRVN